MEKWCPFSHTECKDGITSESKLPCCFWDSLEGVCLQAQAITLTYERLRMLTGDLEAKLPQT